MAGAMKTSTTANGAAKTPKPKSKMVTFHISAAMRPAVDANFPPSSPSPPPSVKAEPAASATPQPIPAALINSPENASPSNGSTPRPTDAQDAIAMPPPTELPAPKKGKGGAKRKAETTADGVPKPRGKPGPKKRKLEDGTTENLPSKAALKRGPKANEGAINAGLRALDRSGTPCRKWSKGSFTLKTFTGAIWEIPRWKAPPKVKIHGPPQGSTTGSSGKENKENSQVDSEVSNAGGSGLPPADASSIGVPPSSPVRQEAAPAIIAASPAVSASA